MTDEVGDRARVEALGRYDILDSPPDHAFDRITQLAARLFGVPIAVVTLVAENRIWFKSKVGIEVDEIPCTPGLCASAILRDGPYVVVDALHDERTEANALVTGPLGLRFYAGAPLVTSDGFRLGTLCVIDTKPRTVTPAELASLEDLAAIVVDEMELRRASRHLAGAERERAAALKLESLGRLAGGVAHEFNNALQGVLSVAQLLGGRLRHDTANGELLAQIVGTTRRASGICRQLLSFAKDSSAGDPRRQNPAVLLRAIERTLGSSVGTARTFRTVYRDVPEVLVAEGVVEQIVVNLVLNARDATDEGGEILVETLTDGAEPPRVGIRVVDDGAGIDEETRLRLFEPFFSSRGGTGLGLSVSYGLARQHGGSLEVESERGRGATFTLWLPAAAAADPATVAKKPRLLLVDDDALIRTTLAELLREDYDVVEAADAETALRIALAPAPLHLLLSDVVMPGLSGGALAQRVREAKPETVVFLMTGFHRDPSVENGFTVLTKPIDIEELRATLGAASSAPA